MIAAALLSGCAETVYRTQLEVYCPPIVQYSPEWNEDLAGELESLPQDYSSIPMAVADYAKLRDTIRRCEQERENL